LSSPKEEEKSLSRSRILKQGAEPSGLNSYSLKNVTSTRNVSSFSYGENIGGSGYETEKDGYMKGFSAGELAGKEQGLKEVEAQFKFLAELIENLKSLEAALIKSSQGDVIQLSLAVAKRIVHREIQQDPERLQEVIREAMEKMNQSETFLIRLHPNDQATLAQKASSLFQEKEKLRKLRFEADPKLQPGECIIETQAKMVDGRVDSQLALFGEAFLKSLDNR
jgi:flagellar assembly protein FliH